MNAPHAKPTAHAQERARPVAATAPDAKAQEYLAGWQRAKADYDNLRRRTDEQRGVLIKTATRDLLLSLLPVIDNLERTLAHSSAGAGKVDAHFKKGVELTLAQLRDVLATQGMTAIPAVDETFDPSLHEAIAHVPGAKNVCVDEHARGYKLHGQVLRPSRVSVGNGEKPKSAA